METLCCPCNGIEIGWLKLNSTCQPELFVEGKKIELIWKDCGEKHFSATVDFGVLNIHLEPFLNGIKIHSSIDLTGSLPECVIFSPFVIPKCEIDHAFFCGEKMGRCLTAEFPVNTERSFEGRYYSALSCGKSTVMMTTPLEQRYDNYFRGNAENKLMRGWRVDFELRHYDAPKHIDFDVVTLQCGNGVEILEHYAEENAGIKRDFSAPPAYGWNSWDYYRWTITEDEVIRNAEFIAADPVLKKYVKRIIIDDGWQYCYGEWDANPNFPQGMKKLAERIQNLGFEPGLWLAPTIVEPHSRIAQWDYDMLACSEGGQPCLAYRCMERQGFLLDPTVKKSQKFLTDLFDRYAGMGYRYFKLDFLASTMEAQRFHDRTVPRCKILPMVMESICRGVAGRAELLGCNYPFFNGNSFVNTVRTGGDIHSRWDSIKHNTLSVAGLFWANKRLWYNDPDFAVCRNPETTNDPDLQRLKACYVECRKNSPYNEGFEYVLSNATYQEQLVLLSLVLMTGGAVNLSDNMPLLNEKGLFLARKVVSAESGFGGRPLDLFERGLPVYWTQKLQKGGRVLVINWTDEEQNLPVDWSLLAPGIRSVRDFWNETTEPCPEQISLPPHSCKLWEF